MTSDDITAAVTAASEPTPPPSSDPAPSSSAGTAATVTTPAAPVAPAKAAAAAGRRPAAATEGKGRTASATPPADPAAPPADLDIEAIFKTNRPINPATARQMLDQVQRTHGETAKKQVADAIKARETEVFGLLGVDEQAIREYHLGQHMKMLTTDPHGYLKYLGAILGVTSAPNGAAAASPAAPSASSPSAAAEVPIEPDFIDAATKKGVFSAERVQALVAQERARWQRELDKTLESRLGPLEKTSAKIARAEMDQVALSDAQSLLDHASKNWEAFEELRPQMDKLWKASPKLTLQEVYIQAYNQFYVPTRTERDRQRFLEELRKAPAPKTDSPSRSAVRDSSNATTTRKRGLDVRGAVEDAFDKLT
jgi:hypothetical protein